MSQAVEMSFVGGRYLAEPVRIIHRWCDVVNRTDQGDFGRNSIHGSIIIGIIAYQQVGIVGGLQPLKHFRQLRRTDFGRSAAGFREAGQRRFSKETFQLCHL